MELFHPTYNWLTLEAYFLGFRFKTGTRGPVAPIAHRFRDVWHLGTSQTVSVRSGDSDDQNDRTCVFVCFRAVQWRMVYLPVRVGIQGILCMYRMISRIILYIKQKLGGLVKSRKLMIRSDGFKICIKLESKGPIFWKI